LYGVVPADANAPDTRGIFGRQLETIRGALVTVLVEESFVPPVPPATSRMPSPRSSATSQ
jgi:hypothetical protein